MERQRSLSFKPTRFLLFSFTISSSVIFLTFFTVWLFKSTPSILKETSFEFNKTSLVVGIKPLSTVHTSAGLARNFSAGGLESSILIDTHLRNLENAATRKNNGSETLEAERDEDGENGNFTTLQDGAPGAETSSGSSIDKDGVSGHFTKLQYAAPGAETLTNEKVEGKKTREVSMAQGQITSKGRNIEAKGKKSRASSVESIEVLSKQRIEQKSARECDVAKGKWVYDETYPLYTNSSCPYVDEGFDCAGNGRLDKDYMKWRWQPQDCDIPRFNATKMLDLIRGKRLVFVGDSINRNQWESMLCMLMGAVKDPKRVYETHGRRITKEKGNYSFKFVDYKCTVEYYVTHFLVHESKARIGQRRVQTLRIDAIDRGSSRWSGADVLIFNTAHWWSHFKTKAGINYYQQGNQVHPRLDVSTAFRTALMTWASWVDKHINPRKTRVFFRSSAPSHFRGGQWNSGGHCKEATRPLNKTSRMGYSEKNSITEEIIKHMKTSVTFLNITSFSEFRIDGHPSVYGKKPGMRYGSSIQDCSHWCLPGVPDTWNELLYFHLQSKHGENLHSN